MYLNSPHDLIQTYLKSRWRCKIIWTWDFELTTYQWFYNLIDTRQFKDTTAEKSKALVDNLQTLDYNILTWKGTVFEWIDKNIPKTTPSNPHLAEAYRLVMQALNDLKYHLPPEYVFRNLHLYTSLIVK